MDFKVPRAEEPELSGADKRQIGWEGQLKLTGRLIPCHGHFDDPSGDIVLVSSEGIHFRVHSHFLRRKSGLLANILDFPSPPITTSSSSGPLTIPLPTDPPTHILSTYLSHIYLPQPPSMPPLPLNHLSTPDLGSLLRLAYWFMDNSNLHLRLLDQLRARIPREAWEVLVVASAAEVDDLSLGVEAVRGFAQPYNWDCPANRLPRSKVKVPIERDDTIITIVSGDDDRSLQGAAGVARVEHARRPLGGERSVIPRISDKNTVANEIRLYPSGEVLEDIQAHVSAENVRQRAREGPRQPERPETQRQEPGEGEHVTDEDDDAQWIRLNPSWRTVLLQLRDRIHSPDLPSIPCHTYRWQLFADDFERLIKDKRRRGDA